ncbi:MAG: PrsW family intramembrane metalloprotease [Parcubacteria group bacterium]|nr:PrsW family intramembrane metalloprotease [Parcubacteria group bacterium]
MMPSTDTLFYALLGGILPAVLWLWFWLKEDSARPEPRGLILFSFIAGMASVLPVFPLEQFAYAKLGGGILLLLSWAFIEEIVKYGVTVFADLKTRFFDEPVDAPIYFITVALGFSALENVLFMLSPLNNGEFIDGLITGNMRFLGATLLHVVASGIIGMAIGFTFYKRRAVQVIATIIGIAFAVAVHTAFNFFILQNGEKNMLTVLLVLWIGVILLLYGFEKVKRIKK